MTIVKEMQQYRNKKVDVSDKELKKAVNKVKKHFMKRLKKNVESTYYTAYIIWIDNSDMIISEEISIKDEVIPKKHREYITKRVGSKKKREKYFEKMKKKIEEEGFWITLDKYNKLIITADLK